MKTKCPKKRAEKIATNFNSEELLNENSMDVIATMSIIRKLVEEIKKLFNSSFMLTLLYKKYITLFL